MTKLQRDFLGPFLECNGSINRPSAISLIAGAGVLSLTIKHVRYTPKYDVSNDVGGIESWRDCGYASAYEEARDTLPTADFERFCLYECGPELMRAPAVPFYAAMRSLFPKGHVDYLAPDFRDHLDLSKKLKMAFTERRNAVYVANHGLPSPGVAAGLAVPVRLAAGEPVVAPGIKSARKMRP